MNHSRMMAEHFGISILESDAKLLHERIQLLIAEAYNRGVQKEREEFAGHAVKIARLAIEEERKACEKACEEERNDPDDQFKSYEDTHIDGWVDGCNSCISAIRARSKT
jgi:hypothetical protein